MSPPLLVLAGPTASGKTALAVALAERLGGEVVSADSQQVYRGFDVGTAKPGPEELARARHHLISILDAREEQMDAPRWARLADEAIADIAARGKLPIVAGGTGLYLRTLLHGVVDAPPRDSALRVRLRARAGAEGWPALHAELTRVDPEAAAAIAPNDRVRIERALEIWQLTGKKPSALREAHRFAAWRYPVFGVWLDWPLAELDRRIEARAQRLFDAGLLEETRALLAAGLEAAPPMASIGYRQARAVLEGRMERAAAIAELALQTRQYAKRQRTWFRKEAGLTAVAGPPSPEALAAQARVFLGS